MDDSRPPVNERCGPTPAVAIFAGPNLLVVAVMRPSGMGWENAILPSMASGPGSGEWNHSRAVPADVQPLGPPDEETLVEYRMMQDSRSSQMSTQSALAPPTTEPPISAGARRSALLIVFLVVFIDLLGFGIVLPLLPRYANYFLEPLLPGDAAAGWRGAILGVLMSAFSAMQFLFAPIWGQVSDRLGRRPILLLGLAGSVVFYALFGVASTWGNEGALEVGLILLFVARVGAGISGATIATAQAVIADSTTPERRSRGMALIGAAFGIGFTFGPLLGAAALSFWPDYHGAPGYVAAGLSLIALVLGIVLLPETWRPGATTTHRRWLDWRGLQNALHTPTVGLLVITFFLATFAFANFEATLSLLTKHALRFEDRANFLVFAFIGLVLMLAQGGLYQVLARRGVRESTFIMSGATLMALGLGGMAGVALSVSEEVSDGQTLLLTVFLFAIAVAVVGFALLTPSVQSLISRRTDPAKQGEILGVNQSAAALARILGPLVGLALYNRPPVHVLPYAVAAGLLGLVLFLTVRIQRG
jgi:DHA1 family tetracycline resistance protein-like MFS transporter